MCAEETDRITFAEYDPSDEGRREALFTLGNGVLVVRSCSPDARAGEHHYPGTYRAGCYDRLQDVIQGEKVENESIVNLPNWLKLAFRIADDPEWLSLDTVRILGYRHTLDTTRALATRRVRFRDRHGRITVSHEERLVSMADPNLAGLRVEFRPENWAGNVEIRSGIDASVENSNVALHRAYSGRHLSVLYQETIPPETILLGVRTRQSAVEIATAARTRVAADHLGHRHVESGGELIADRIHAEIRPGGALVVEKTVAVVTSRDPGVGSVRHAALASLQGMENFDALRSAHLAAWEALWRQGRIEADGEMLSRATALHRFHILQTVSPHSTQRDVGFPARGWQEAYHGQIFWDDIFVFPFLSVRFPDIARSLLMYRYRRLDQARLAARGSGYSGAMFPWRSASSGVEETPKLQFNPLSGHWMRDDTRLQRHIGAAIAFNIWHYYLATGDRGFLSDHGAEMMVEIARFWASISRLDGASGRYDIRNVIGPDEYHNAYPGARSAGLDNNAYTNVMAGWALSHAVEALGVLPSRRRDELITRLRLDPGELEVWKDISRRMRLVFDDDGVLSQFEGFERLKPFDGRGFAQRHPQDRIDWVLEARGESIDAYQATKQAGVLMLLHLLPGSELSDLVGRLGYQFTPCQMKRTAEYYLSRMTQESSLSRIVCAGALARLDRDASYRFFQEAMKTDFYRGQSTSSEEGLHLGAMAGTIDVLQRHYMGLKLRDGAIELDPNMPPDLGRMRLAFSYHGGGYELEWSGHILHLRSDPANASGLTIVHRDRVESLAAGKAMSLDPGA